MSNPETRPKDAAPVRSAEPAAGPPRPIPLIRFGLWAMLSMVLVGLVAVWFYAPRPPASSPLPQLGTVPAFTLVERDGRVVTAGTLLGTPWVADFVFTRCAVSCPRMTSRMLALGERIPEGVKRVSISVDPEHDTPEVLAEYAASYGITGDDWLFLTGEPAALREWVVEGFKLGLGEDPTSQEEPITHSTRFVLVDAVGVIRGYYDAFDGESFERLVADVKGLGGK